MSENKSPRIIDRRTFFKSVGAGALSAAGTTLLTSCGNAEQSAQEPPVGKMTYRTNPGNGDKVSVLGYGMMRLPVEGGGSGRENPEADIDQEMVNKQVDYAIEHGVNYFDTSPAYCKGKSEQATGIALSRHKREEYLVATKLSNFSPDTWSREASIEMFENSMKELRINYIDYYLLHAIGMGDNGMGEFEKRYLDNGMLDYLQEQKKKGLIRNLGFSYHGDIAVFDRALAMHDAGEVHWDFVQIQLNYMDWQHAKEINPRNTNAEYLYSELDRRHIPAVIMEPLLGGRLANLPDNLIKRLKEKEPEKSVASWAFRYCASKPNVLTMLSGMTFMEHLRDNLLNVCPLEPLSDDDMHFLENIATDLVGYNLIQCNDCKYCMPCPYGIDIPAIFVHYNKCRSEERISTDTRDPKYAEQRRAFLIGYDRKVPRLRQADHCIGCGQCIAHCPQKIQIPQELHRISRYVEQLRQNEA